VSESASHSPIVPEVDARRPPRATSVRTLVVCAALCAALPAQTGSNGASFGVSARVLPQARLIQLGETPVLDITAADLARGFASTHLPAMVRIQSNSRAGFALDLLPLGEWFSTVEVTGLQGVVTLGSEGGTVVQRWNGAGSADLSLGFRFTFAGNLSPGRYPLPLQLRVRALDQ
jgi:hypothetical protein